MKTIREFKILEPRRIQKNRMQNSSISEIKIKFRKYRKFMNFYFIFQELWENLDFLDFRNLSIFIKWINSVIKKKLEILEKKEFQKISGFR